MDTTTAQQPKAAKQSNTMVFLLLVLAIIWYVIFTSPLEPATPQPPASAPALTVAPQIDCAALVVQSSSEAYRRNHNAEVGFVMQINQIISSYESTLTAAAAEAAKTASTYSACSYVASYLAWDKVKRRMDEWNGWMERMRIFKNVLISVGNYKCTSQNFAH